MCTQNEAGRTLFGRIPRLITLGLTLLLASCATLTPKEMRENINYDLAGINLNTPALSFGADLSNDQLMPSLIRINPGELFNAMLSGDSESLLKSMQLQLRVAIHNNNPVGIRVHEIYSEVWLDDKLLTTLADQTQRDIPAESGDTYTFSFAVPDSVDFTKVLLADAIELKGEAELSLLDKKIFDSRVQAPFHRENVLPFGRLREQLRASGLTLEDQPQ